MDFSLQEIAWDSFVAHLAIPLGSETFLYALVAFDQTDEIISKTATAWLASVAAYLVNYLAGCGLNKMRIETHAANQRFEKVRSFFSRWLVWGLLLAGKPGSALLALGAGVFAVPPLIVLGLAMFGHAARYGWLLFG